MVMPSEFPNISTARHRPVVRTLALLLVALAPSICLLLVVAVPLLPCPRGLTPLVENGVFFAGMGLPLIVTTYLAYGAAVAVGAFWRTCEERPRRLALSLALLGGFALFLLSIHPAVSLRWWLLRRATVRARPLIAALEEFRKDNGRYPASLDRLAPRYLKRVPGSSVALSPEFEYTRADAGDPYSRGPELARLNAGYDLSVYCPAYLLSFDSMHYWPSQQYPDHIPGGDVVRKIDGWAYVHD